MKSVDLAQQQIGQLDDLNRFDRFLEANGAMTGGVRGTALGSGEQGEV
ncbi:hypothetical protein [Streptomyces sp. WG7]